MVVVGFCLRSHATQGVIFVKVQNGFEIDELHDVAIGTLANNNLLAYESSTSLWKNKTYAELGIAAGTGTTNFVTKWSNATGGLSNSQIFDNGVNVGIGTNSPTYKLDIVDATGIMLRHSITANTSGAFRLIGGSYTGNGLTGIVFGANLNNNQLSYGGGTALAEPATQHIFFTGTYGTKASGNEVLRIANNGNVGINSSNPSYKLDVVGTGRFTDNVILGAAPVGNNSLLVSKNITGGVEASGVRSSGQLQSIVTTNGFYFRAVVNQANYEIANIIVYESQVGTISGTGTNLINFRANVNPTGFTNVYGFQSQIASGTNRYGIYNNGTAQNHFRGNVGIGAGSTVPTTELDVLGITRTTNLRITNGAAVGKVWQCNNVNGAGEWVTPLSSERYIGEWAANSGVAPSASPTTGDYYVVNTAGTYLGITYAAGDEIYWNGTAWLKRSNFLTLPIATASVLGGIKIGTGLAIDGSGVVSVASLATSRTISATGDGTWSVSFNGSADVSGALTLADVATAGTYQSVTVNAKGLVTAGTNPTTLAGYGITDVYTKAESDASYVSLTGSYSNPTWITALAYSKLTGVPTTFAPSAHTLDSHSNVTISSNLAGEVLKWDGTAWVNNTLAEAGIQATLGGTGLVLSTSGVITYITDNSTNWNTAFTDRNKWDGGATGLVAATGRASLGLVIGTDVQAYDADLQAIAGLAGTSGILRKTAANTWSLDTTSYFTTPTGLTTNYVSKWGGSAFANSQIFDNGTSVGIAIASPSATSKLHVNNAVGNSVRFQNTYFSNSVESGTGFARGGIFNNAEYIDEGGATKIWKIRNIGANDAAGILFGNSGTLNFISVPNTGIVDKSLTHAQLLSNARLTILATGLVGINTTTPAYTLDVSGTIRTTNLLITSGATSGNFLKCNNVNGTSVWSSITTSDISNLSSWAGSTSITTLGTITAGTWNGTAIATTRGGTGLSAIGTANQMIRVNAGATALEYFTPTFISGNQTISITGDATGSGTTSIALTLANSGVTLGTYRSVTVNSKGLVTAGTNPTTILGYGITDAYTKTESDGRFVALAGSYANPTWITDLAWTKLTGVPTTFAPAAHTHAAVDIVSGVIAQARLGSGTASATTFLRGDQTWATLPAPTLTSTRIGFGSGSNLLTSSANFAFEDDRIISIKNGGTSKIELARYVGLNNYGLYVHGGNLELQVISGGNIFSQSNHSFQGRILLNNLAGTAGQVLTSQGSGANPTWTTVSGGTQDLDDVLGVGNTSNKNILLNFGGYVSADKFQFSGESWNIYKRYDGGAGTGIAVSTLSGTGTRMVVADANGVLNTQAIPSWGIDQVLAAGNTSTEKTFNLQNSTNAYLNFKNNSGALKAQILHVPTFNTVEFNSTSGNKLQIMSGTDLDLYGININMGYSNTTGKIGLQGTPFNFNLSAQNLGMGENGNQWGWNFIQSSPQPGDRIIFFWDGTRFVMSHVHTYTSGGKTYLTID